MRAARIRANFPHQPGVAVGHPSDFRAGRSGHGTTTRTLVFPGDEQAELVLVVHPVLQPSVRVRSRVRCQHRSDRLPLALGLTAVESVAFDVDKVGKIPSQLDLAVECQGRQSAERLALHILGLRVEGIAPRAVAAS